ncbi:MAG: sensor histidine kinase, partial [Verrucomicrobia bacterium]|nr:sensor histidine kinase [Verrucomicrobiota bacterium]
ELNQPLGSIVVSADACSHWLDLKPPNLNEVRQAVEAIIRDGTRASSVVTRFRDLLRLGKRLRERLDINDVIREVIALVDGELRRSNVFIQSEMTGSLPLLYVDRVLLHQVILNLVMNAMEAMLAVDNRARVLRIQTQEQHSNNVLICIQDSGVGIEPQNVNRIFEAFYTTKTEGIGMGLTISRSIIEAHGGRLWAVTSEMPGCTFCFTLPVDGKGKV